ncbi:MAG: tRNA1(Val) (adenine(37)-N6)-methyltransferase [Deltaproteobacteria bacterium]
MERVDHNLVREDESLDDLILGGMKVIQPRRGYRFSLDAVLLAHFPVLDGVESAVDLGSGGGVIPLIMSWRSPSLSVIGIELQAGMAERSMRTISFNDLDGRIRIIPADIREIKTALPPASAGLVVCNPPFWKKGEGHISNHPEEAIARHELEVEFKDICWAAAYLLKDGGHFCVIQRAERLNEVMAAMTGNRLQVRRIRTVHSFAEDDASLVLVEGRKNSRGGVRIMPPLVIYQEPGFYSSEVNGWYGRDQNV